jgi:uncharacterized membrane protein YeaQ/YmgE (transglycosylase-associated protein family)
MTTPADTPRGVSTTEFYVIMVGLIGGFACMIIGSLLGHEELANKGGNIVTAAVGAYPICRSIAKWPGRH